MEENKKEEKSIINEDEKIERAIEKTIKKIILEKYVKCDGCGALYPKDDAICYKCELKHDGKNWIPIEEENEEDDLL
ncbi:MAG: hypothetical protein N2114_05980 [Candidatus Goldbacteria bacterium]|nr:hypothetical protein [Candidatus Goldiibacteriota bacterium]